jgi:hypothetical protein
VTIALPLAPLRGHGAGRVGAYDATDASGGNGGATALGAGGMNDIARSASAVIVSDGLTPRFAPTAAPSTT